MFMSFKTKIWLGLILILLSIAKVIFLNDINNDFLDFISGLAFGAGLVWFLGSILNRNRT